MTLPGIKNFDNSNHIEINPHRLSRVLEAVPLRPLPRFKLLKPTLDRIERFSIKTQTISAISRQTYRLLSTAVACVSSNNKIY